MNRGRGGFGARSGRGGRTGPSQFQQGPPDSVLEMGSFLQSCEGRIVCRSINVKIPYFNAPIYLENKTQVGKVDEILGPVNEVYFTVIVNDGVKANSFKDGDKFFISPDKLLPLERFLPQPKPVGFKVKKKNGGVRGVRGAASGGRGVFRGGRGGARGGFRGGRGGALAGSRTAFRGGRGSGRGSGRGGAPGGGRGGFRGGRSVY